MKKFLCFLFLTSLIYSCTTTTNPDPEEETATEMPEEPLAEDAQEEAEEPAMDAVDAVRDEEETETENQHLIEKKDLSELEYLMTFIPKGHLVLDYEYGDVNKDELKNDVILISHDAKGERRDDGDELARTAYILTRTADDKLKLENKNEGIIMCSSCGGVFGDPYNDIAIKNGYFSLEHYGGSNWRWTHIITFKYTEERKDWFLHKVGGTSYHTSNPDDAEETVKTTKDFGVVAFSDYEGEE